MSNKVTVCCVFWGNKFTSDYVYNLKKAVEKNSTVPFDFVCYSDRVLEGIDCKLLAPGLSGWWNKLQLFKGDMKGRVVYFDLDTLITGNIDWLLQYDGSFLGIEDLGAINAHQPHLKGKLQSGVLAWRSEYMNWIYLEFMLQKDEIVSKFRGDGEYLDSIIKHRDLLQDLFPKQLKSYKYEVYPDNIDSASIICFHGRPSIIQSMSEKVTTPMREYLPQPWVKNYWGE